MAYTQWLDYGSRQREESFPFAASHMAHVSQPLPSDYTCYYSASAALQRRVPFPADPHVPRSTSLFDGEHVARLLKGNRVGDTVPFHPPLNLCGQFFQRASVERDFGTASKAQLMRFEPGGKLFICKFDNILQEYAVMCALEEMNRRWRQRKVEVCGQRCEVVTFMIFPLSTLAGLVEVVPGSRTMRELAEGFKFEDRRFRVLWALRDSADCLDRLAATTAAFLTANYALGLRDGHDDNVMLRLDGSLFRVDFGFVFGASPELDTPLTFVPNAVAFALGEDRWHSVVAACGPALAALSGSNPSLPAWDCLDSVPPLRILHREARDHVETLSFTRFCQDVRCAHQWSLTRAVKNTFREALRYLSSDEPPQPGYPSLPAVPAPQETRTAFPLAPGDPFAATPPGSPRHSEQHCARYGDVASANMHNVVQLAPDDPFVVAHLSADHTADKDLWGRASPGRFTAGQEETSRPGQPVVPAGARSAPVSPTDHFFSFFSVWGP